MRKPPGGPGPDALHQDPGGLSAGYSRLEEPDVSAAPRQGIEPCTAGFGGPPPPSGRDQSWCSWSCPVSNRSPLGVRLRLSRASIPLSPLKRCHRSTLVGRWQGPLGERGPLTARQFQSAARAAPAAGGAVQRLAAVVAVDHDVSTRYHGSRDRWRHCWSRRSWPARPRRACAACRSG